MNDVLKYIDRAFEKTANENIQMQGEAYIPYEGLGSHWQSYITTGYGDTVLHVPNNYFMTVERCTPDAEQKNYHLAVYSPCILPVSMKTYLIRSDSNDTSQHRHDYLEMVYVLSGKRTMQIEERTVTLKEKELCIFNLQCAHKDLRDQSEGIAFYCCVTRQIINSEFVRGLNAGSLREFFRQSENQDQNASYILLTAKPDSCENIESNLAKIFWELEKCDVSYDRMAGIYTARLLNSFQDPMVSDIYQFPRQLRGTKLFSAIAEYIDQNLSDISLEKLCRQFHYQADYYNRLIKKETGMTYSQYVHSRKMEKAQELLTNTRLSIRQIMICLGYSHHSFFYQSFQKETGMTPSEYRRKQKPVSLR